MMVHMYPPTLWSRALTASIAVLSCTCILTQGNPSCADELVSRPDVVRTTEGSNALFRWQTHRNISDYHAMICQYQLKNVVETSYNGYSIINGAYENRTNASISGNKLTFNLKSVTEDDSEGNYTMTIHFKNGSRCDDTSLVYIYRAPTKPVLQISDPGTQSEGYNVTCLANVTSVPAAYRLPVSYTWSVRDQGTQLNETKLNYTVTGKYNETVSLFSPDVTKDHDIDITCVASEQGSPLHSAPEHIPIPKYVYTTTIAPGKDSYGGDNTSVIIVASVTGFILVAMAFIVGYLCWERKHKPERSRRRTQHIRQSLAIPRLRHGRSNQAFTPDSDQEIYNSIRNSAIMSTIDTDIVPTLPKRPPGLEAIATGNQGVYDYADPLRLALRGRNHPQDAKKLLPNDKGYPEALKYGSSTDINNAIRKDVDLYMGDVTDGKVPAPTDVSVAYNALNKDRGSILGDDDDTAVLDNMAYHSVAKGGSQPISATAPSNVPPPESCVKRNSYVASPTGKKRTESKTKVRQRDSATRENTASVQLNVANANSELNTPEPDLYFLAQSLVDHHARPAGPAGTGPAGTGGNVGTPEGILQADRTLSDVHGPRAGSSHVSENTVSSNVHRPWSSISGDDDDTALLDNMAYHSVAKGGSQPISATAPSNVPPPESCVKRNSYVASPTGKKRTESKTKVRQRDSATRENTASVQSNVANVNSELNTPEPDLYFLAQSLVDHHTRPAGTGGTVGTPEGGLQADRTLSDVHRPRAGSSHVSENTVSSNVHRWSSISGDDDTAVLDNMAYHSVGKEGSQPTANTAPGNVPPPQSCVLRNSYVASPTVMFSNARQRMSSDDDHDLEIIDNESYVTSP